MVYSAAPRLYPREVAEMPSFQTRELFMCAHPAAVRNLNRLGASRIMTRIMSFSRVCSVLKQRAVFSSKNNQAIGHPVMKV
jgi:hypothetical protein